MIFKTTITDINKMAVAIDKISTMTLPNYLGLGTAIEGLTAKQAALVLSTRNLSQAELEEVVIQNDLITKYGAEKLVKEGLLSANSSLLVSEKAVNAEKLKANITQSALNKEKAEEFVQTQLIVTANGEESSSTVVLNKALMDEAVKRGVLSKEKAEEILSTYGVIAADKLEIGSKNGLVKAIGGVIAANASLIASTVGISALIFVLGKLSKVSDEVKNKAQELGDSFNGTLSDIDNCRTRIEELHKIIHNGNSSIEEVTNARQTLMSVQDELIEKYGTEKETIELITSAINNQSDAFDKLIQKKRQETLNEFDDAGFWNNIGNWIEGYDSNIDRMKDKMEDVRQILSFSSKDFNGNQFTELEKLMKKRGWEYQETLGGFVKYGNLKEIYSELLNIQNLAKDIEVPDYFLKDLTKDANKAKETIKDYGEVWDAYILENKIFSDNKLADTWHKVNEAYSEYQKAFATGNQEEIEKSLSVYSDLLSSVLSNSDIDDSVKEYFSNMYPALQAEVEKWEFRAKILPKFDTRALNGKTKSDVLQMLQEDGLQYGEQTFNSTLRLASEYGIITGTNAEKVQQLLDLLVEWGILQDDINDTASKYGNETPVSLSSSDFLNKFETQYKPALSAIQSSISQVMEATEDGIKLKVDSESSINAITEIRNAVDNINNSEEIDFNIDTRSVDEFSDKLMDALDNGDLNAVKQVYTDFANDVVNSMQNMFGDINESNMQAAQKALESVGILNAEQIITEKTGYSYEEYAAAKQAAANSGVDLNGSVEEVATQLEEEGLMATEDAKALMEYVIKKAAASGKSIDVSGAIAELAKEWEWLQELIDQWGRYNSVSQKGMKGWGNTNGTEALGAGMYTPSVVGKPIEVETEVDVDLKWPNLDSSARGAGSKAGKSFKDGLKEQLSDLDGVISGITSRIDDNIEAVRTQKEEAVASIDAQIDALNEQKSALEDQKKALEEERDARIEIVEQQKKQLELAIKAIDKQIKQKEKVIKGIQDEIKAMQDANEQRKREIDLQKAQFELEKMQNMRTKLVK